MIDDANEIDDPQWHKAETVHDWRNHVPGIIRSAWLTFTYDQRRLLIEWAEQLAEAEEWE